jgi:hypothetical protein
MQTSHFQGGLIAFLAAGLGFSLASSSAIGYPAGAAVSSGTNPVVSAGGTVSWGSSTDLFTAPVDQDLVITDIVLSGNTSRYSCKAQAWVHLETDSRTLGEFSVGTPVMVTSSWMSSGGESNLVVDFESGLRLPAGETARLRVTTSGMAFDCSASDPSHVVVNYAIGGYLAQP